MTATDVARGPADAAGIVLDAYAARSCPVKTHNQFDQTALDPRSVPGWAVDEAVQDLFDGGDRFEAEVIEALGRTFGGTVADLRNGSDLAPALRSQLCLHAMSQGIAVIVGGLLPLDLVGHRSGSPDLLVRAVDGSGYFPVDVKFHKVLERRRGAEPAAPESDADAAEPAEPPRPPAPNSSALISTLDRPGPEHARTEPNLGFRISSREADLMQLAHYRAMLLACGYGTAAPLAGVVGTDDLFGEPSIVWMDLDLPLSRTFSRSEPTGRLERSISVRYTHELAFRLDIARRARQIAGNPATDPDPLVRPIRTKECERCMWWSVCAPRLDPDDVSLRIDKGALDPREITTLRRHGIETVTELAAADLDAVLDWYLPEVTHRSGGEERLRTAARRARMLLGGHSFERISTGPIEVPAAEIEIDFDLETTPENRAYLWGFRVHRADAEPEYVAFSRFTDLTDADEDALGAEALGWLRSMVDAARARGERVLVYHYSDFESVKIRDLAARDPDGPAAWARTWARGPVRRGRGRPPAPEGFCDLWSVVKSHYFGAHGLGLKVVASEGAGFHWRDDDPGGLNSQRWFLDAIDPADPAAAAAARTRVLEYNEDDVIATARLRAWLRAQ